MSTADAPGESGRTCERPEEGAPGVRGIGVKTPRHKRLHAGLRSSSGPAPRRPIRVDRTEPAPSATHHDPGGTLQAHNDRFRVRAGTDGSPGPLEGHGERLCGPPDPQWSRARGLQSRRGSVSATSTAPVPGLQAPVPGLPVSMRIRRSRLRPSRRRPRAPRGPPPADRGRSRRSGWGGVRSHAGRSAPSEGPGDDRRTSPDPQ